MDTLQTLAAQIEPLFANLATSGPTEGIAAIFQNAYTQTFAQFPHAGASDADQTAICNIIKKTSQFLSQEQINAMITAVNQQVNNIPPIALLGYMVACSATVTGLSHAQRAALPPLALTKGKPYPLPVTRYAYRLKNST
jgi:ABC-type methionine transport system permease subunit